VTERVVRVGVGRDRLWSDGFLAALERFRAAGAAIEYAEFDMLAADWVAQAEPFDIVLWMPYWQDPAAVSFMREKVLFLERYLGKTVVPNVASTWHYESKSAQHDWFTLLGVPTPRTVVTFTADDADARLAEETAYPLVFKGSAGAGSSRVRLARTPREARAFTEDVLAQSYWDRFAAAGPRPMLRALGIAHTRWFRSKVRDTLLARPRVSPAYWQEYVPGLESDLRITAIGDRFASWFRRRNRPGDFRASGSGLAFYDPPPEHIVRACLELNARCGFDSMGYDILGDGEDFLISEMSHTYPPRYTYNAPGHYRLEPDGSFRFIEGHVLPQDLWVEWALGRAGVL
jgi:glutathione synthase/RimK-type ligase-like ATP-grasp enzyme